MYNFNIALENFDPDELGYLRWSEYLFLKNSVELKQNVTEICKGQFINIIILENFWIVLFVKTQHWLIVVIFAGDIYG